MFGLIRVRVRVRPWGQRAIGGENTKASSSGVKALGLGLGLGLRKGVRVRVRTGRVRVRVSGKD